MIQAKPDNSSFESVETRKPDKTQMEAVAAQQQAAAHKQEEPIHNPAPNAEKTAHPGSVLDLKV